MVSFSIINKVSGRRTTRHIFVSDNCESNSSNASDYIKEEYIRPTTAMAETRPTLRKRSSSFFGKKLKSDDYYSISQSRSSSRQSEITVTEKESTLVTLASKIKSQSRMTRKVSGVSLTANYTIVEEQSTTTREDSTPTRPVLTHAKSVPSLHALNNLSTIQGTVYIPPMCSLER